MMYIYLGLLPLEENMLHCFAKQSTYSFRLSLVKMLLYESSYDMDNKLGNGNYKEQECCRMLGMDWRVGSQ